MPRAGELIKAASAEFPYLPLCKPHVSLSENAFAEIIKALLRKAAPWTVGSLYYNRVICCGHSRRMSADATLSPQADTISLFTDLVPHLERPADLPCSCANTTASQIATNIRVVEPALCVCSEAHA